MKKIHPLAVPALILAAVFGGLGPILGKFALFQFSPFFIITLRFGLALLVLAPALILTKNYHIRRDDIPLIFGISLLGSVNFLFFIIGLQYTTSIVTQIIYLLVPVIVLILSKIFFKESFSRFQIFGVLLGILGASLVLGKTFSDPFNLLAQSLGSFKGNFIILIGAFSWSLYLILSKKASIKYPPITLTTYTGLTLFFLSLIFIVKDLNQHLVALINAEAISIFSVIGLAFFNSVAMLFLYQWGNKHATPFAAASVLYLSTLTTAVIAVPLFGEKITLTFLISGGLIFLSVYLATIHPFLKKRKR